MWRGHSCPAKYRRRIGASDKNRMSPPLSQKLHETRGQECPRHTISEFCPLRDRAPWLRSHPRGADG